MKYFRIRLITDSGYKYANFLNHYEPYNEYYKFMDIGKPFIGFSNTPIIFERDKSYKNDEPISDFLITNWTEIIVSERIYKMLKEKYSNEIDFYECFASDEGILKPYYILRAKYIIDVLDRKNSLMGGILGRAIKSVIIDNIPEHYNYFYIKDGEPMVISKKLYEDLKALSPTNFEVTPIATTSEKLKAREKNLAKLKKNDKLDSDEFIN